MSEKYCIHGFVSGRVQGVWFRAFCQQQARANSVTGWAKNLADGRVEVMLAGQQENVETVLTAVHQGPQLSKVEKVASDTTQWQNFSDFTTA